MHSVKCHALLGRRFSLVVLFLNLLGESVIIFILVLLEMESCKQTGWDGRENWCDDIDPSVSTVVIFFEVGLTWCAGIIAVCIHSIEEIL